MHILAKGFTNIAIFAGDNVNTMNWRLFILFLFLSVTCVYSSDVKFYNINAMYGISMREVASVCKDGNGFIWASSKTGMLRITDSDYRIYPLPYKTANIINVRLAYDKSLLIAYTNNGQLFRYNELYDRFDLFADLRELLENSYLSIGDLIIDNDHTLWIPTSSGLCRYKDGVADKILGDDTSVQTLTSYDDDHLILVTHVGIELFDIRTLDRKTVYADNNLLHTNCLFFDKDEQVLWVGAFADGLYYCDLKEKSPTLHPVHGFPKQPIWAIEECADSTLLIGIDGQGMWQLDKDKKTVLNIYKEDVDNPLSLRGDGVYDVFCDGDSRVWVSTYSGGLSFYERQSPLISQIAHQLNNPNSLGNNDVNKILQDSKGDIWFATNNGISRRRAASGKWDTYYQNKREQAQVFLALCEDEEGNIWAGSYSSGFYVLHRDTGKELAHYPRHTAELKSDGKFIMNIYKDSEGDIWIGGVQDVICYRAREKRFHTYVAQPVRSFTELSAGKMLLACTYGLLLLDKETESIDYLAECLAQDVLVIGNDIWVATCGDGLLHCNYETRQVEKVTSEAGLPSNFVNSIMYDNGYLWVGTENGLCRYNPADGKVHTYYSTLALSSVSYNVSASCKLAGGELIWGTNNGAVMFDPNKLYHTQLTGRIFFQDINISGRSIKENSGLLRGIPVDKQTGISLNYNQNTLALEVLPIGMSSDGIKFSWKMEGLDTEWTHPSNQQIITYTNIPNGKFQLKIRMYDNSLSHIVDERMLDIDIIPPYWQTWWFHLAMLLLLLSIAFFALKFYINRLKQRHAEDKIRFFTNTAHDLRTSITLINAPISELNKEKQLSEKGHYYLNLATEQSERLSNVATQLLDFQKVDMGKGQLFPVMTDIVGLVYRRKTMFKSTAEKKSVTLEFSSDRDSYLTAVDELKIEKVVDNLISNAIKYSHTGGKVEITLHGEPKQWSLEVKDYGLGISAHAQKKLFKEFYRGDNKVNSRMVGSGIGLLLVKNYVLMHGGEVSLSSKENEGSTFSITIPYKEVSEAAPVHAACPEGMPAPAVVAEASAVGTEEDTTAQKKTLLIVDDNKDLLNFLKCSFEEEYNVWVANDGAEAWELLQGESPELIISDVMMPEMDGFELCKLIKSTFETSHIPVILLTSLCDKSDQLEGLGLGAEDYITKPFDVSLLKQRIKTLVRNREIVREKVLKISAQPDNDSQAILANALNDSFVKKAVEVIQGNMQNKAFDKDSFALEMHVSASLLYKKIKALTGQSPSDFIKSIRLNRAMELLQSRKYTITEVSELCGYSSISYFSTVFKKHFGKSPNEV